jgi:hypothetical protein
MVGAQFCGEQLRSSRPFRPHSVDVTDRCGRPIPLTCIAQTVFMPTCYFSGDNNCLNAGWRQVDISADCSAENAGIFDDVDGQPGVLVPDATEQPGCPRSLLPSVPGVGGGGGGVDLIFNFNVDPGWIDTGDASWQPTVTLPGSSASGAMQATATSLASFAGFDPGLGESTDVFVLQDIVEITARVAFFPGSPPPAVALASFGVGDVIGIDGITPNSGVFFVAFAGNWQVVVRNSGVNQATFTMFPLPSNEFVWIRMRVDYLTNTLEGYTSPDGVTWTLDGTAPIVGVAPGVNVHPFLAASALDATAGRTSNIAIDFMQIVRSTS